MSDDRVFVAGGTVQAGGGVYVARGADAELLDCCRQGIFAYVLTPRQLGKSSLMVRTGEALRLEGVKTVSIDLTTLGTNATAEQWYLGLAYEVRDQLDLSVKLEEWWDGHARLGVAQRFALFWADVVLPAVPERIVIFIDEIDSTLSLAPFTDDFFAEVRAFYNARATNPSFNRLSFVMLGVATPGDLIRDPHRTPFNIGRRVDLGDFSLDEAAPLVAPLGTVARPQEILGWVFEWTHGHPYLTQRVLVALPSPAKASISRAVVRRVVEELFLGERSAQDNNLQFVRDMLTKRSPSGFGSEVLRLYRDVRRGQRVPDAPQSIATTHLKLSGVVRVEGERLRVRNRIYDRAFDTAWVRQHLDVSDAWKVIRRLAFPVAAVMLVLAFSAAYFAEANRMLREQAAKKVAEHQRYLAEHDKERTQAELQKEHFQREKDNLVAAKETLAAKQKQEEARTVLDIQQAKLEADDRFVDKLVDDLRTEKKSGHYDASRFEAVLDSVASTLYKKGDLQRLAAILKDNQDLVPENYGMDATALELLPTVGPDEPWPFVVEYSLRSNVRTNDLTYHWRFLATQAASIWGLPFPLRLQFREDANLPSEQFRLLLTVAGASTKGKDPGQELPVTLRSDLSEVVITKPSKPAALVQFFEMTKIRRMPELKYTKTEYWLVPSWTQPVWKVTGWHSFHREGAMALAIANAIIEKPGSVLSRDAVSYLLARLAKERPKAVGEALAARGLDRLREDLIELVKDPLDQPLTNLEYVLDSLADAPGLSSEEAAARVAGNMGALERHLPSRLPGHLAKRPNLDSGSPDAPHLYDEVGAALPRPRPEVRVFVSTALKNGILDEHGDLLTGVTEATEDARSVFIRRFGFSPPGVVFRLEDGPGFRYRIEVADQNSTREEARPIDTEPNSFLADLEHRLEDTYVAYRTWWLTPDRVSALLDALPKELRDWVEARYSLTDLKLILRALIGTTPQEVAARRLGRTHEALAQVPRERTLEHLDKLVPVLVYIDAANLGGGNPQTIADLLRTAQGNLLGGGASMKDEAAPLPELSKGATMLAQGKFALAVETLRAAGLLGSGTPYASFATSYARASQASAGATGPLKAECVLPSPGQVAKATGPSPLIRSQIEGLLGSSTNVEGADRRLMQLCLLLGHVRAKHHANAKSVENDLERDVSVWLPSERFLYASLLLDEYGDIVPRSDRIAVIERHLRTAIVDLDREHSDAAFEELLGRYKRLREAPSWYVELLQSLSESRSDSYWIPFLLGTSLASDARSFDEVTAAKNLLAVANDRLGRLKPERQSSQMTWMKYASVTASTTELEYLHGAERQKAYEDVVRRATDLINEERRTSAKDGPTLDSLYAALISARYEGGTIDEVDQTASEWLQRVPDAGDVHFHKIIVRLAKLDAPGAASQADQWLKKQEARNVKDDRWQDALRLASMIETAVGAGGYEQDAREFIGETQDGDRDFVRLLLCWRLTVDGKGSEGKQLIEERMKSIHPETWNERLRERDPHVWSERLVAYFSGKISRAEIFGPVSTRELFQTSHLDRTGLAFESVRSDAYFYDGLYQGISGDPATRVARQRKGLEEASRVGRINFLETHLARNLLPASAGHRD